MVLQTVRYFILAIFLSASSSAVDMMQTDPTCPAVTELSFTEKEACLFDKMTIALSTMSAKNTAFLGGGSLSSQAISLKYMLIANSPYVISGKLNKASSLLMEKSSNDIKKNVELILIDTDISKLYMQSKKIGIENQILLNDFLIRKNSRGERF